MELWRESVFKVQSRLVEGIQAEAQLQAAAYLLCQSDYEAVITERSIENLCGYPLCNNKLPPRQRKGRYKISLKDHKVYDLQETWLFCCSQCLINSRAFSDALQPDKEFVFEQDKVAKVLNELACLSIDGNKKQENVAEEGNKISILSAEQEKFSSQLLIHEQEDGGGKKIAVFDYARDPSDAIEGYVPRKDRQQELLRTSEKKGTKKTKSSPKGVPKSEANFTSTIICGEPCAEVVSDSATSLTSFRGQLSDQRDQNSLRNEDLVTENNSEVSKLKSAMKSGAIKQLNRSVTWADEKEFDKSLENGSMYDSEKPLTIVSPGSDSKKQSDTFDKDGMSMESVKPELSGESDSAGRFESAEAIAQALTEAADAVVSGEISADEAVANAGICILPCTDRRNPEELEDEVEMFDSSQTHQIWPSILSSGDEESYEAQNCWYDSPPEGFCLELSPFATMWMAFDRWITASSVAYLYGREESDEDNPLIVNGREYPRKIVSSLSAEIERTLGSWISRALAGVVQTLRLSTSISTLEQALGHFLKSMTLVDAIPAFRMKHWHLIVTLFLDALSVHRVPSLGRQMMNKRPLIDKVLNAAEFSYEEYEAIKELLLPLGRNPQFSSQSGG
ncbi:hypothetical protein SUGI_0750050 [Cryptomeria japonica]|uniref:putative RNA polymerase II subunit B1 CTD phosphatase RPAP2 homolog n=1 Tax=Cryptomeria japonica TaxID=3369 RepID=UPI002414C7E2|nr:putative RNA polymerase II subunit B1 CTD phosphatase RPAP2 homolog [Cryptomeria japonica]GLJ37015.1 hypothetical protein SUGI_0750050 [Cryptomeria japonica]